LENKSDSNDSFPFTRRQLLGSATTLGILPLAACGETVLEPITRGAEVLAFDAAPTNVCKGGNVTVSWEVDAGEATLQLINAATGSVEEDINLEVAESGPSGGTMMLPICEDTQLRIVASSGENTDQSTRTIRTIPPEGRNFPVTTSNSCYGSADWWIDVSSREWDARAQVTTVLNRTTRTLKISHDGLNDVLLPGGASISDFNGYRFIGLWDVNPDPLTIEEMLCGGSTDETPLPTFNIEFGVMCDSDATCV
jgi:hypothetical protein